MGLEVDVDEALQSSDRSLHFVHSFAPGRIRLDVVAGKQLLFFVFIATRWQSRDNHGSLAAGRTRFGRPASHDARFVLFGRVFLASTPKTKPAPIPVSFVDPIDQPNSANGSVR